MPQSQSETPSDPQSRAVAQDRLLKPVDANASEQSHHEFDAVVVCIGNYHQPNLPDVKGIDDFPGLQMHAHNYRNPAMFEGQVVIAVGASFSGTASLLPGHHSTCCKGCTVKGPCNMQCCIQTCSECGLISKQFCTAEGAVLASLLLLLQ